MKRLSMTYTVASLMDNTNPEIYKISSEREITQTELSDDVEDEFDSWEVFDILRSIKDPEHPLTLEELNVVDKSLIQVDNKNNSISIQFTPTVPHCSLATLIGLSIRVKLVRSLPPRFKVDVKINPGSHVSEIAVNKQLNDKERVAAALENFDLLRTVNKCLEER
ncbi:hypothetical protein EB796_003791 [Bugula neritina]|uniref:MIP18 family-like domain-containing protein n=1 Tax=Bugula neritina TaxID=10212 RepID=A0A7J7KIZ9_BUGNE|nr:hypothetical protein EB796_003791 [Bugula neritina]